MDVVKNFVVSRIAQVASRYLAMLLGFLVLRKYIPQDLADRLTGDVTTFLTVAGGALFLTAWDWIVHSKVYSRAKSWYDGSIGRGAAGMLLIALLLLPSGCAAFQSTGNTPQDQAQGQLLIAETGLLTTQIAILDLHAKHRITDDQYRLLQSLEQTAQAYITAAQAATDAGQTVDSATQLKLFRDALMRINAAILNVPPAPPTLTPSTLATTLPA